MRAEEMSILQDTIFAAEKKQKGPRIIKIYEKERGKREGGRCMNEQKMKNRKETRFVIDGKDVA
jgi:hypothetical protein